MTQSGTASTPNVKTADIAVSSTNLWLIKVTFALLGKAILCQTQWRFPFRYHPGHALD